MFAYSSSTLKLEEKIECIDNWIFMINYTCFTKVNITELVKKKIKQNWAKMIKLFITLFSMWVKYSLLDRCLRHPFLKWRTNLTKDCPYSAVSKCWWSCVFYLNIFFCFSYPALNHSTGSPAELSQACKAEGACQAGLTISYMLRGYWKGYCIKIVDVHELKPSFLRCKPACGILKIRHPGNDYKYWKLSFI